MFYLGLGRQNEILVNEADYEYYKIFNCKQPKPGCSWKDRFQAMYVAKMAKLDKKISQTEAYEGMFMVWF